MSWYAMYHPSTFEDIQILLPVYTNRQFSLSIGTYAYAVPVQLYLRLRSTFVENTGSADVHLASGGILPNAK